MSQQPNGRMRNETFKHGIIFLHPWRRPHHVDLHGLLLVEHSQLPGPLLGPEGRPLDVVRGHHSRGLETEVRFAVLARELHSRDI